MPCEWRADRSLVAEPFATHVTTLLQNDPGDWVVTCGARDFATEAAGYARWLADPSQPKYTRPDNSAHCCVPALAVDITLRNGRSDDWDYHDAAWTRLVAAVRASPNLHSLVSIGDVDHIEAVGWRRLAIWPSQDPTP